MNPNAITSKLQVITSNANKQQTTHNAAATNNNNNNKQRHTTTHRPTTDYDAPTGAIAFSPQGTHGNKSPPHTPRTANATCCEPPPFRSGGCPLHDIVITNIVWCMAYQREVEGGVYCSIVVQ